MPACGRWTGEGAGPRAGAPAPRAPRGTPLRSRVGVAAQPIGILAHEIDLFLAQRFFGGDLVPELHVALFVCKSGPTHQSRAVRAAGFGKRHPGGAHALRELSVLLVVGVRVDGEVSQE